MTNLPGPPEPVSIQCVHARQCIQRKSILLLLIPSFPDSPIRAISAVALVARLAVPDAEQKQATVVDAIAPFTSERDTKVDLRLVKVACPRVACLCRLLSKRFVVRLLIEREIRMGVKCYTICALDCGRA